MKLISGIRFPILKTLSLACIILASSFLYAQDVLEEEGPLPPLVSSEESVNQRLFMEGFKAMAVEDYEKALAKYSELLGRDPNNHVALFEMARAFLYSGNSERAMETIFRAIRLDAENIWYRLLLAELLTEEERFAEAAEQMKEVVRVNQDNPEFFFELAYLQIVSGNFEEALKTYDRLQNTIGIHEDISLRKHRVYLELNDFEKAEAVLLELIEAFPTELTGYHHLANFYMHSNQKEKANQIFNEILEIDSTDPMAQLGMAEAYRSRSDFVSYLEAIQPLLANPEIEIDLKVSELMPFLRTVDGRSPEDLQNALMDAGKLLSEAHPTDAKAFAVYGDILYNIGKPAQALEQFEKALELNASVFAVWEQALIIAAQLGNSKKLVELSDNAIEVYPNQAFFFFMNAIGQSMEGNYEEAVDMLNDALMMSGRNEALQQQIHAQLGSVYYNLQRYAQSDQAFEKAIEINPKDATSLNNYSYYLAVRGKDLERAKTMSAKSNELSPDVAAFQDTYGYILYKMKNYTEAKVWFEKALDNSGREDPEILEHYGNVLFQLNKIDEAVNYWQIALDKGGDEAKLRKKIESKNVDSP